MVLLFSKQVFELGLYLYSSKDTIAYLVFVRVVELRVLQLSVIGALLMDSQFVYLIHFSHRSNMSNA
jgi:hypothetical protein